jgi:hypothetical protein
MLMLMYSFIRWRSGKPYDFAAMRRLMDYLWGLFILDVTFETLEIVYIFYEHGHHWAVVGPLLQGKLFGSYVIGQMLIFSGLPLLLLGYVVLFDVADRRFLKVANLAALCIVIQVLLMRFNVVIGGQMISKSDRGYVDFHFEWIAREGVIPALVILAAPFVTYWVLSRFLPIFSDDALSSTGKGRH